MEKMNTDFQWVGSKADFVDRPAVINVGEMEVGRFGGNSSAGQYKNEDACLIWSSGTGEWEFVVLMDAHNTAESAEAVLTQMDVHKKKLKQLLSLALCKTYFRTLEQAVLEMFQEDAFLKDCRNLQGETACLIVVRKGKYVWWFSVGDCLLYLFHPELASFGQYQLNQRHFYEWIGEVNTFDQLVPCYSAGTRELRQGRNRLLLTTDGLVECPGDPYGEPASIMQSMAEEQGIGSMLSTIQRCGVRDSSTIISWEITNPMSAALASNQ